MAGGIQRGTEAGSAESKQLDGDVKSVAEALAQAQTRYFYEVGHKSLDETKSHSRQRITESALPEMRERHFTIGCMPDGGMWFDAPRGQPRRLMAAFEAKHQQDGGNAIERWAKNYLLCRSIWPDCVYVTFMTGEGARVGGVLHDFGETMRSANGPNCVFYYAPEGFSQEGIFNIMTSILDLDLEFEGVKQSVYRRPTNNYSTLFAPETQEEREARLLEADQRFRLEQEFSRFAQDPTDPIYPVWHRIPAAAKTEAQEIAVDMIQQGIGNARVASELVECFLK